MSAERETQGRYLAALLADKVGADFAGGMSGVQSFGVFVKLDETGADGLIPVRSLGAEYFRYDRDDQVLTGTDSGIVIGLGQRVTVRLAEAIPVTGGLMLELLSLEGEAMRPRGRPKPGKRAGAPKRKFKKAPRRRK